MAPAEAEQNVAAVTLLSSAPKLLEPERRGAPRSARSQLVSAEDVQAPAAAQAQVKSVGEFKHADGANL